MHAFPILPFGVYAAQPIRPLYIYQGKVKVTGTYLFARALSAVPPSCRIRNAATTAETACSASYLHLRQQRLRVLIFKFLIAFLSGSRPILGR